MRVAIASSPGICRSGLKALLEREPDIQIAAEAGTAQETLDAVRAGRIDVLILDVHLPGEASSKLAEAVLQQDPRVAIVVLTMYDEDYYLEEFIRAGARAFVHKKSTGVELIRAVRTAHRREQYIDPSIAGRLITHYVIRKGPRSRTEGRDHLSPREHEVCKLLAYGHTNAEIAEKLSISIRTVENHRTNVMAKLNVRGRAEIVRFAIDHGLLQTT